MLWFLASYAVFDWIGVGNAQLDMTNKSVEDIIALFGNLNTSKFPTELSQVLPQAQSMIGAVDLLQRLPDGRLRLVGWVVDKDEREQPVSVFAIIPTKVVLATRTGKKRDDVASLSRYRTVYPQDSMMFSNINLTAKTMSKFLSSWLSIRNGNSL